MSYSNNSTNRRAKSANEIILRARAKERELAMMVAKYSNKKALAKKGSRARSSIITSLLASFRLV